MCRSTDRGQRGFTLLELLVVMVIIGLLAAYVAPRYFSQVGRSEVRSAQAQVASLRSALDTYRLDMGGYPSTEQGLAALTTRPAGTVPTCRRRRRWIHGASRTNTARPASTAISTCCRSARTASRAAAA